MRWPWKLNGDLRSRWFGTYEIDDPRPMALSAPYTYFIPSPTAADAVQQGDRVKANFRPIPGNRDWDAERMWVKVQSVDAELLNGVLGNDPFDIPQLRAGAPVCVPRTHIIDVIWGDGHDGPEYAPHREYWERCFVDACVVDGLSHVDYFYRENPDMAAEGDEYLDGGWRFRGTPEAIEDDEPMGWACQWSAAGQDYIRSEHI